MARVRRIAFPPESRLRPSLDQAFYSDAFETDLRDPSLTASEIARRAFAATPAWLDGLVQLRDRMVSLFGLKPVGRLKSPVGDRPSSEPAIGDAFSIFRVISVDSDELVLGIDDTHLDVRLSFLKRLHGQHAHYVVGSWVKTHNALGRAYMLPVAPVHRLIVRLMMWGVPM
jgi:hypothetical protein